MSPAHRLHRIACILVPDFPIAALVRANPELRDQPLALSRMPSAPSSRKGADRRVEYQPHTELSHVTTITQGARIHPA